MCALTGVPTPDTIDGYDLSSLLCGDEEPLREAVFTELPLSRVIRTQEWKLCHRPRDMFGEQGQGGELYHLGEDPWEMHNLYADPGYADVRDGLLHDLFDWLVWSTRYGNVTPPVQPGADGKTKPPELRRLVDEGKVHAL
jgi:arylsulfatase A-like enzyme